MRASAVDRDLDVPVLVALLLGGDEVLLAVLDPLERPAQQHGGGGERAVLGVEAALRPEAAADVGGDDAQLVVRPVEQVEQHALVAVRPLRRDVDGQRLGDRIGRRDHAAAFHEERPAAVLEDLFAKHMRGAGERRVDVADVERDVGAEIAERRRGIAVRQRRARLRAPRRNRRSPAAARSRRRPARPRPRRCSACRRPPARSARRRSTPRPWRGSTACRPA